MPTAMESKKHLNLSTLATTTTAAFFLLEEWPSVCKRIAKFQSRLRPIRRRRPSKSADLQRFGFRTLL